MLPTLIYQVPGPLYFAHPQYIMYGGLAHGSFSCCSFMT